MEKFNPSSPEYKKVADLPTEEQEKFTDVRGGFVRKEAAQLHSETEKEAHENYKQFPPRTKKGEVRENWGKDGKKVTMKYLYEEANKDESKRQQEKRDKEFIEDCQNRAYVLEQAKKGFGSTVLYDFIPSEFRSDEEIMYYALTRDKNDCLKSLWHFTGSNLSSSKDFIKKVAEKNWDILHHLHANPIVDEDIMRAAFESYRKEPYVDITKENENEEFEKFKLRSRPRSKAEDDMFWNGMG